MATLKTDSQNYGKQFFSGVAVLTISTFIVKIIGMFYKIPMMAYLGAEGMGYFNSAYDIYSLLFVISTTGIPVAISILISENKEKGRIANLKRIYRISLIILATLGLIGALLLAFFHKELAVMIKNDSASYSILAISPTILLICVASAIRGYFQGNQIMMPTAVSQVIEAMGKLLLGLGFAIIAINKGFSPPIVAAFAVLGLTVGVALSLLYLVIYKLLHKLSNSNANIDQSLDSSSDIVKSILSIAIPITISSTILGLTKIIDMTMILGRLNEIGYSQAETNAIYGSYSTMAVSLYNLPATIISTITLPLVPMLASAIESGNKHKENSVITSSLKLTAIVAMPAGLGISVFSKQILELLFFSQKEEIDYVAPLLSLLGLSVFLTSMITTTNAILQSYKMVKKPIISMVVGTVVKIVFAYLLIGSERINIYGAPISTFISITVIASINLYFIIKTTGGIASVLELFAKPFIASAIAMILGIATQLILQSFIENKLSILIVICVVVLIYFTCALKIKAISENEILILPKGECIYNLLKKIHLV